MDAATQMILIAAYFWLAGSTTVFLCRLNGFLSKSFARSVLSGLFWPAIWAMLSVIYFTRAKPQQ